MPNYPLCRLKTTIILLVHLKKKELLTMLKIFALKYKKYFGWSFHIVFFHNVNFRLHLKLCKGICEIVYVYIS